MNRWKEWRLPKTKVRKLMKLGATAQKAYEWGNSRKAYWRIARSPILHKALGTTYWWRLGLKSIIARYEFLRQT
ncbi:hypothetical protein ABFG93_21790 (plasmid) [Pseudalkalibacillus hwajinpoensis]